MKTYKTKQFLDEAFVAVPRMRKALAFKVTEDILKYDLSLAHILILREIVRLGSPSMKDLVNSLDISSAMMTHFTDQLESKEFVERKRSDNDRRVVNIFLTQKGKDICDKIKSLHKDRLSRFLEKFSSEDREEFIRSFGELYRLIIKYGEPLQ